MGHLWSGRAGWLVGCVGRWGREWLSQSVVQWMSHLSTRPVVPRRWPGLQLPGLVAPVRLGRRRWVGWLGLGGRSPLLEGWFFGAGLGMWLSVVLGLLGSSLGVPRPAGRVLSPLSGWVWMLVGLLPAGPLGPLCSLGSGGLGLGPPCVVALLPVGVAPLAGSVVRHSRMTALPGRRCCSAPACGPTTTQRPARLPRTGPSPVKGCGRPGTPGPGSPASLWRRLCLSSTLCATLLFRSRPPGGVGGWGRRNVVAGLPVSGRGVLHLWRGASPVLTGSGPRPPRPSPMAAHPLGSSVLVGNRRVPVRLPAMPGRLPGGMPVCVPGGDGTPGCGTRSPSAAGPARPGR